MKEKILEDVEETDDQKEQGEAKDKKVPWYMIDSEKTVCKFWDLFITLVILYELIVVPFILVYPHFYESMTKTKNETYTYGTPKYYANITKDEEGNYIYENLI